MHRRRQLVEMATSEKLRRRQAHAASRASVDRVIAFLDQELTACDAAISAHLQQHNAALASALSTVPGVGRTSVAVLLADLPELGKIDRRRNCCSGWCRTYESRLWPDAGPALHLGWPPRCTPHSIHGDSSCGTVLHGVPCALRAAHRQRQSQKGRARSLHAQVAGDVELHGETRLTMESDDARHLSSPGLSLGSKSTGLHTFGTG